MPELVRTAWGSSATFRGTDMRGGANGARIRLAPQKDWKANDPAELSKVLQRLEGIRRDFNGASGKKKISLAGIIVLGGIAAVEKAAKAGGNAFTLPFIPGRVDAAQAQTDRLSFAVLEPAANAFRNYLRSGQPVSPVEMLVEKASLLSLTVPEMTALVGGMRVLNANTSHSAHGVFTRNPGTLTNDFFVNLLDSSTRWAKSSEQGISEGRDRRTNELKWKATSVDLIFGSNSELRAIAEVYASADGKRQLVQDFAKAWTKVMNLDRFDLD